MRKPSSLTRIFLVTSSASLALSACGGGGGGGVNSTPPPTLVRSEVESVTPLNPTPASTSGTYTAIALVDRAALAPAGTVRIDVDPTSRTYVLTVDAGAYRPPQAQFSYLADDHLGKRVMYTNVYSDGSRRPEGPYETTAASFAAEIKPDAATKVDAYIGLQAIGTSAPGGRHVSLGAWNFAESTLNATGGYDPTNRSNSGYFVFGDRTAPGDIPLSGTARYGIEWDLGDSSDCYYSNCEASMLGSGSLDVDFGNRTIAAGYEYDWSVTGFQLSIDAAGSSPISTNGDFHINLAGTAVMHATSNPATPDQTAPANGLIAGAFFGPQAAEIGGVYTVPSANTDDGATLSITHSSGAFTAIKQGP